MVASAASGRLSDAHFTDLFVRVFEECALYLEIRKLLRAIMYLAECQPCCKWHRESLSCFYHCFLCCPLTEILNSHHLTGDLPHLSTSQSKTLPSTHPHLFFLLPKGSTSHSFSQKCIAFHPEGLVLAVSHLCQVLFVNLREHSSLSK